VTASGESTTAFSTSAGPVPPRDDKASDERAKFLLRMVVDTPLHAVALSLDVIRRVIIRIHSMNWWS
jgi:hypothetical protein